MKYEIIKTDTIDVDFHKVYRIKNLVIGELGGYIENEDNLSQEGDCWVHRNAVVYGRARVRDNTQIVDFAKVCGDRFYGDVIVYDNARVRDKAKVFGNAKVFIMQMCFVKQKYMEVLKCLKTHRYMINLMFMVG